MKDKILFEKNQHKLGDRLAWKFRGTRQVFEKSHSVYRYQYKISLLARVSVSSSVISEQYQWLFHIICNLQPPVIIISTPTQTLCKKPGIGAAQHHKKNLERASWVIVKTNKIKRTRLITMRSKPDYVEADLLLLLLMLLLWFLLL